MYVVIYFLFWQKTKHKTWVYLYFYSSYLPKTYNPITISTTPLAFTLQNNASEQMKTIPTQLHKQTLSLGCSSIIISFEYCYNVIPIVHMYLQQAAHSLPVRVSYGVPFVSSKSDVFPALHHWVQLWYYFFKVHMYLQQAHTLPVRMRYGKYFVSSKFDLFPVLHHWVLSKHGHFSQETPHSSPMRASYRVSIVTVKSDPFQVLHHCNERAIFPRYMCTRGAFQKHLCALQSKSS